MILILPGLTRVLLLDVITIELTAHEILAGLGLAVNEDDSKRIVPHDIHDIRKLADKRGAYGGVLHAGLVDEAEDHIVLDGPVLLFLGIVIQSPFCDGDGHAVRRGLDHLGLGLGQAVDFALVGAVHVRSDNFHGIRLSPRYADRTAIFDRLNLRENRRPEG